MEEQKPPQEITPNNEPAPLVLPLASALKLTARKAKIIGTIASYPGSFTSTMLREDLFGRAIEQGEIDPPTVHIRIANQIIPHNVMGKNPVGTTSRTPNPDNPHTFLYTFTPFSKEVAKRLAAEVKDVDFMITLKKGLQGDSCDSTTPLVKNSDGKPIFRTWSAGYNQDLYNTEIHIPKKKRTTKPIQLRVSEVALFTKIWENPNGYFSKDHLESVMIQTHDPAFQLEGGFERTLNSLNSKLRKWRVTVGLDKEKTGVVLLQHLKNLDTQYFVAEDRRGEDPVEKITRKKKSDESDNI